MNTIVVTVIVTTPTSEIEQLAPNSNTGISLHSQWRCSTSNMLLPATSAHTEHLDIGQESSFFSAIVYLEISFLATTPQIQVVTSSSCAVISFAVTQLNRSADSDLPGSAAMNTRAAEAVENYIGNLI